MTKKLRVISRFSLSLAVCLVLLGSQSADAQPGFGQNWTKFAGNPVVVTLGAPGSWNGAPSTSSLVWGHGLLTGNTYRVYLGGFNGVFHAIGSFSTTDLETGWGEDPGNPVVSPGAPGEWDGAHVGNPMILSNGGNYYMWFTGVDTAGIFRIGYATSPDGAAWTKYANNPVLDVVPGTFESLEVTMAYVILDGGTYKMWYTGVDDLDVSRLAMATSPDGISWTRAPENPLLEQGTPGSWEDDVIQNPVVLKESGSYLMWYQGGSDPLPAGVIQTGFAASNDGVNWTKDSNNNPLITVGSPGQWDSFVAGGTQVFKTNDSTYQMIYGGTDLLTVFGAGLATLVVPVGIGDNGLDLPTAFALHQNYPNPFNPTTIIEYSLPNSANVSITIYNTLGQQVRTLVKEKQTAGLKSALWNGRNDLGEAVGSGVYFYTLKAGKYIQSKKMLLLQ